MFKKYNQIFRTYSYLRLSVEDGDRVESDSIKNQRVGPMSRKSTN